MTLQIAVLIAIFMAPVVIAVIYVERKERQIVRTILGYMLSRVLIKEREPEDGAPEYHFVSIDCGRHWYHFTQGPNCTNVIGREATQEELSVVPDLMIPMEPYNGKLNWEAVQAFFAQFKVTTGRDDEFGEYSLVSIDRGQTWSTTTFRKDSDGKYTGDTIDGPANPELVSKLRTSGVIAD